jgi:hypothetical protein
MYRLMFNSFSTNFLGQYMYPVVTRITNDECLFLNWGYEEDPPMAIPLSASDEPNRACIQLYHHTATQTELEGKQVLEVSCGSRRWRLLPHAHPAPELLHRAGFEPGRHRLLA